MRGERSEEDIKGGVTRSGKMEVKWLWLLRVAQLLAELLAEQGLAPVSGGRQLPAVSSKQTHL